MSRDPKYLLDMLLAAEDARSFASSLSRDDLEQSRLHQYTIVRALEIIGEAGRMVSPQTKDAHPEIPWQERYPVASAATAARLACRWVAACGARLKKSQ
jgi:uncharacterized protein with HEPN domain